MGHDANSRVHLCSGVSDKRRVAAVGAKACGFASQWDEFFSAAFCYRGRGVKEEEGTTTVFCNRERVAMNVIVLTLALTVS